MAFEWTDELACEFADFKADVYSHKTRLDQFKILKQPKKDYEILYSQATESASGENIIKQVRRLSDGEIFTIGDIYNGRKILSFEKTPYGLRVWFDINGYIPLNDLKKDKEILFTTEDGKDIYENDNFWMVFTAPNGIGDAHVTRARKELLPLQSYQKTFSTKDACDEWLLMNKPCLSISDLLDNGFMYSYMLKTMINIKELVKQKIKL